MAFTIYKSSDSGAPSFYGSTGSYVALLDACLVNGYGSKPGAGWIKPFPNTSSFGSASLSLGAWTIPSGSSTSCSLFINDNAPGAGVYKECRACGWEVLSGGPSSSVANTMGSGSGQFPTPAQSQTYGFVTIRKSATNDSSSLRQWLVLADSSSFYAFIATGDTAGVYYGFGFGDIYSFKTGSSDNYRCIIIGRTNENSSAAANDGFDYVGNGYSTAVGGNFMARASSQIGTSITIAKHGDGVKGSANFSLGNVPFPNGVDNALYISPIWVVDSVATNIRGQLRGFYQNLHPIAQFTDGQTFTGALEYGGKTFLCVKTTPNSGMYVLETSNTLLGN